MMIVGNKCDLKPEQKHVATEDGRQMAEEFKCGFTEASARLDINVSKAFEQMIGEIEKSQNPAEPAAFVFVKIAGLSFSSAMNYKTL
ncbi:MAG: hypothetical protein Q9215_003553 [Flavoplaca cf. flavocitrina]